MKPGALMTLEFLKNSLVSALRTLLLGQTLALCPLYAQTISPYAYDIGSPSLVDYYVDPVNGSNFNNGTTPNAPWKTVQKAWNSIASERELSTGYRINLLDGTYDSDNLPNYWELKKGSAKHPIILRAAPGQTNVRLTRDINMANVSYFYLININITPAGGGDTFHCEKCDHLLIRGCVLNGGSTTNGAHETVKINQSQYVYIENNNISYADDNNIDFVGVQYGHIIGNTIHEAVDWCTYVKGGSAYIRVEGNTIYNCGTGGFTAGQGSGFQFMTSPWLHYEAYDIKFINNVIHDTTGAAFGTNGGYNILLAHNTAYTVGQRSHMVEVVFGERTCDGERQGQSNSTCSHYYNAGGWGPGAVDTTPEPIGNRNVYVLNNLLVNPTSSTAPQHFAIYGPRTPSGTNNIPSPQQSDNNLSIKGNIIWNGTKSTPIGIEDSDQGCQSTNNSCTATKIITDNTINSFNPAFRDSSSADFRPSSIHSFPLPTTLTSFPGGDRPLSPASPSGELSNEFNRDLSGVINNSRTVGAYQSPDSDLTPQTIDGGSTPGSEGSGGTGTLPVISIASAGAKLKGKKIRINVVATITSDSAISSAKARLLKKETVLGEVVLKNSSGSTYKGRASTTINAKKITLQVIAENRSGEETESTIVKVEK
jgi:hypothetical protein